MRAVSRLLILTFVLLFGPRLALHGQQPPGSRFVDGGRFVRDTQTVVVVFGAGLGLQGQQSQGGRFVDVDGVVRDKQNNLMWEKKDMSGGLHDVNRTVT